MCSPAGKGAAWRGALAALAFVACGGDDRPDEPVGPVFQDLDADQVMVEVEHYLTRDGVRRAHLRADTAFFLTRSTDVLFRRYTVDFYGPDGGLRSVLTAEDGVYDTESGDMRARGDVVVVNPDESQRLETEEMLYDSGEDRLRSDRPFLLIRGRDTIRGTGFVTDPALDSLNTRQPAVVSPPEGGEGG